MPAPSGTAPTTTGGEGGLPAMEDPPLPFGVFDRVVGLAHGPHQLQNRPILLADVLVEGHSEG